MVCVVVLGVGEKGHIYTGVDGMGADATRTYTRRQQTTNHSSFFDLLHPEDRAAVVGLYMCLVAQQEQQQEQQRLRQLQEKHPPARQVGEGKGGWEVEVAVEEDEVGLNLWGGVIVCVCVHWEVRCASTLGPRSTLKTYNTHAHIQVKRVKSNAADPQIQRGQITCRVHAQNAGYVRTELSLRCGINGVVCFARPE